MRHILFISSGSIGDAIISTGIIGYLADQYPGAKFTIAVGPAGAPLFAAFPQLEKLIVMRKRKYNLHWLDFTLQILGTHWDMVVDLRGSMTSYLVRTRARRIFRKADKSLPKAEQLAALFNLSPPPPTRLWSSQEQRDKAAAMLPPGKRIILLAPRSNSVAKDWPIERFAELAKRLMTPETVFVVLASGAQTESIQPLVNALPPAQVIDASGKTDLMTAYAMMEKSELFIGNDSGLFHMAAAAKIPAVGIYGPSNDKTYAPRGLHIRIVKVREFAPGEDEIRGDDSIIRQISVEQVVEAIDQLISAPHQAQHR